MGVLDLGDTRWQRRPCDHDRVISVQLLPSSRCCVLGYDALRQLSLFGGFEQSAEYLKMVTLKLARDKLKK